MTLRSPIIPDHILRRMSQKDRPSGQLTAAEALAKQEFRSEKEFHRLVKQYLALKGVRAVISSRMDKRATLNKGAPDLLWVMAGKACALELKKPSGTVQPEQQDMLEAMRLDGWRVALVRSMEGAVAQIKEWEATT